MFVVCRSPPPPFVVAASASEEGLQEHLLAREEMPWREEALVAREEKARISEKALVYVSSDLDAEWAKAEATQKEYLDKMEAHTSRTKNSLGLDKMLGEKKVQLDEREQDLDLHEVALVEAQSWGLNPQDNCEELMEIVELRRPLKEAEVECVIEVGRLVILVRDVSKVLVDLGMPHISGIPRAHVWQTMSWRWRAPSWNTCGRPTPPTTVPRTRSHPFPITASFRHPALVFACLSSFPSVCEYLKTRGFR
jgi:hypothetical protein